VNSENLVAADRSGGSAASVAVALPLSTSSDKRLSGWGAGLRAGASENAFDPVRIFTPGYYLAEGAFGRGTRLPLAGPDSGLRGYMEIAFRMERQVFPTQTKVVLKAINRPYKQDIYTTAIRTGASSDPMATGLVEQKASRGLYTFDLAVYIPNSLQSPYATLSYDSYWNCGFEGFRCGMNLHFIYSWTDRFDDATKDVRYWLAMGPAVSYRHRKKFEVRLKSQWNYIQGFGVTNDAKTGNRKKTQQTLIAPAPAVALQAAWSF